MEEALMLLIIPRPSSFSMSAILLRANPGNTLTIELLLSGVVWTPSQLQWTINGNVVRTLTKESTLDPVVPGLYHYPQTPSRIQLS